MHRIRSVTVKGYKEDLNKALKNIAVQGYFVKEVIPASWNRSKYLDTICEILVIYSTK